MDNEAEIVHEREPEGLARTTGARTKTRQDNRSASRIIMRQARRAATEAQTTRASLCAQGKIAAWSLDQQHRGASHRRQLGEAEARPDEDSGTLREGMTHRHAPQLTLVNKAMKEAA